MARGNIAIDNTLILYTYIYIYTICIYLRQLCTIYSYNIKTQAVIACILQGISRGDYFTRLYNPQDLKRLRLMTALNVRPHGLIPARLAINYCSPKPIHSALLLRPKSVPSRSILCPPLSTTNKKDSDSSLQLHLHVFNGILLCSRMLYYRSHYLEDQQINDRYRLSSFFLFFHFFHFQNIVL